METKKKTTETEEKKLVTGKVFGGTLNIRQKPDLNSRVVGSLPDGMQITIEEDLGEWLKIEHGYVMAKWVEK